MAWTSCRAIWNGEMPISTCVIASKIKRQSMTSAGMINAQHPKNEGVVVQTTERKPSLFEKIGGMV